MGGVANAAYSDVQTTGSHADPDVSLQNYTYERLLEYWTMVYTLGLLAGVVGTEEEKTAAKDAVVQVLENAATEAIGLLEAAATAADDNTLPFVGAGVMNVGRGGLWAIQGIGGWFGKDAGFNDDIANLDRSIRDSVAVDINQVSQASKYGKATLEGLTRGTFLEHRADTSGEDAAIAATQATVDRRNAQVMEAVNRIWEGIKDAALARYNQFIADWEKGGLGYAVGTLGIDAAFLAVETAIVIAAGALTSGAAAVALKVAVTIGKRIAGAARRIVVAFKRAGHHDGRTGEFDVPEGSVVDHAKDHNGFGDDHAGVPRSGHDNAKDSGGPDTSSNHEKTEVRDDGSYRNPSDPVGVRRTAEGEAMVQDPRTGNWHAVSQAPYSNLKGNFGEVMGDRYMESQGYRKLNGPMAQMGDRGHNGIDGVYVKDGTPPTYVVADAKYGSAGLGTLTDGRRQMSPSWISERLEDAVGEEEAFNIMQQGYTSQLLKVDKNGNITEESLSSIQWRQNEL